MAVARGITDLGAPPAALERSALIVGTFLSSTPGPRCVCEDLSARLSASGWKVITTSAKAGRASRVLDMMGTAWRARRQYEVVQVDVYDRMAFYWAEAVCWVLRRAGKPYVLTLHGGTLPSFSQPRAKRVRRLLGSAAAVTVPSHYLLDQMRPFREDLHLLPNPLDLSAYHYRVRERAEQRLIWLRAFHGIYNPSLAPRVLAALAPEFPAIQLAMVGPDKGDGSLQETQAVARALQVCDAIKMPGGVPKSSVPHWLDQADIFLNTTNEDNTPISVLEAMASGLCVVSTDVGGLPYMLKNEVDALLVPPDDPEAMAAAVRRVLTDRELSQRLSRNARAKAEQFDWSIVLPQWQSLLEAVAGSSVR